MPRLSDKLNLRNINLLDEGHLRLIIHDIESDQNKTRKRKAWRAMQCLNDNQREFVVKRLKFLYPETYKKFRVGNIKVCKKVVEKLAKAYKIIPRRELKTDKETRLLNEIYDNYDFHRTFKEADDLFNLHKYVCLWLTWQNPTEEQEVMIPVEEGSYVLHALHPYEYDLIRDEMTGKPLFFIYSYPDEEITGQADGADGVEQIISESKSDTSAQTKVYKIWSPTLKVVIEVKRESKFVSLLDIQKTKINVTQAEPNYIERLPVTYLQADTSVDYPVSNDLADSSIDWNVSLSDLKTAAATQGHGQLVITHPQSMKFKVAHMGMHTALKLAQSEKPNALPTEAKYISASPNLSGQLDVLKFDLLNILDDYRIKNKGSLQGGVERLSSGFDRLLSEADVQDVVEDNQQLYAKSLEQGVFKLVQAYEETMISNPFTKSDSLSVTFEKPKVMISDKETLENIKQREELGTLLSYEKHMILDPNLSRENAIEREALIQAEAKERMKRQAEMMGLTGEEENDEDEEEVVVS